MYKYFLLILILSSNSTYAQNRTNLSGSSTSGLVIYSSRVTLNNTTVSSDTLQFNRTKSLFQWQNSKKPKRRSVKAFGGIQNKRNISPHDNIGEYNLYNAAKDSLYSRKYLFDQVYFVKEKNPDIQWNITDSSKTIGGYRCTMATAHFRGRNYTAWFTPKIPVHYGPWKLIGLPGLILRAHDQKNDINFSAQKVVFKNVGSIGVPARNGSEKVVDL
jgi:GLPGLI family protein